MKSGRPRAVLFDLDGTLIDSAPDLAGAANDMRAERGLSAIPYAELRRMVGSGARGMVGAAFGLAPSDAGYQELRDEFLQRYEARMTSASQVFGGVEELLAALEREPLPWGIVTNKAARYSEPVTAFLGLRQRAATLVSGDTTPHAKPHPAPLLEAARQLGSAPADCVYVGDDRRDVDAGRAAGMVTFIAAWGYLGPGEPIDRWGADAIAQRPLDLIGLLDLARRGLN